MNARGIRISTAVVKGCPRCGHVTANVQGLRACESCSWSDRSSGA